MDKKKIVYMIFAILLTLFFVGSFGTFSYFLIKLNVIPTKYLIIGFSVALILFIVLFYLIFSKKKYIGKVIAMLLVLIVSIVSFLGIKYLMTTYDFFKGTKNDYDTLSYSVLVLKDSSFEKIEDLKDKDILYLDDDYKDDIKSNLSNKITYNELVVPSFGDIPKSLLNKEVDALVLESSYVTLANQEVEGFSDKVIAIYTFLVDVKTNNTENEEEKDLDILNPFALYISGIDQYGDVKSVRGRSDVNQILLVNPKTNHILIVNTPRDYYVQLDGTTGLRDKLTHAGIYGIDKSVKTLENLYDIDIDYYLRVNFNTLVQIVDVIGGIDVYSDKTFNSSHIRGWTVKEGINHMSGKEALAFSRERYAYITGDNHRGENQQQVITSIINKVTSSSVLVSKYNSILNTLNGSFQTNMPMNSITSFIRYQLEKMPSWKIESYAVTGRGSMDYTYSMGKNYLLYVMEPNIETVNIAKQKMQEVLNEN